MTEPTSFAEYVDRFNANQTLSGRGVQTTMHLPCPFCAAPDFMVYYILESESAMNAGATCSECGRSARAPVFRDPAGNITFQIVQTGGKEQPDWMQPRLPVERGNVENLGETMRAKAFIDLHALAEDDRIEQIGQAVAAHGKTVAVMIDGGVAKVDRYVAKLKARFPGIAVLERMEGPTAGVVTLKIGPQ